MKDPDLLLVDVPAEIQLPDALTPSLGLMYIASFLKQKGYNIQFFDGYINYIPFNIVNALNKKKTEVITYSFPIKDFIREILKFKAPIIGFSSSFTSSILSIHEIVKNVKKKSPDTLIVLGGYHVSALPKETLNSIRGCDIVVIGEGELTMEEIIRYKKGLCDITTIKGIAYKNNGRTIQNPSRGVIKDLDNLPFPDRSLSPISHYNKFLQAIGSHECAEGSVISSRGCPNQCIYCCVSSVHGRQFRARSATNVVNELETIKDEYNTSYFKFQDDIFTLNKKRVINICTQIIDRGLDISWGCQTRVDCVNKEILEFMKKAGCKYLSFGVESGDSQILSNLKKHITLQQIETATKVAKSAGLHVNFGLIIGNPGENKRSIRNTINLVKKLKPNSAGIAIMIPYPGSALYNSKLGKISNNWHYFRQSGAKKPPFLPKGFNSKKLFLLWQNTRKEIYKILGQEIAGSIIRPHINNVEKILPINII
ncbi:MAG: B12-binding domain-containing radical SAM protein [Promethearchaeota archaeon]